jgi:hypothetical protein
MGELIRNARELITWFSGSHERLFEKGVFVSSTVRKQILISPGQGRVVIGGRVRDIQWESVGGGVWRAYIIVV